MIRYKQVKRETKTNHLDWSAEFQSHSINLYQLGSWLR